MSSVMRSLSVFSRNFKTRRAFFEVFAIVWIFSRLSARKALSDPEKNAESQISMISIIIELGSKIWI